MLERHGCCHSLSLDPLGAVSSGTGGLPEPRPWGGGQCWNLVLRSYVSENLGLSVLVCPEGLLKSLGVVLPSHGKQGPGLGLPLCQALYQMVTCAFPLFPASKLYFPWKT